MKATRPIPRPPAWGAWLAAAGSFACFWPSLSCGWLNWDDGVFVLNNAPIRAGLGWPGLRWAFTASLQGIWQPLAYLTYMLDFALWGPDARGFHLTNVMLHSLNAALFFLCARRLLQLAEPREDRKDRGDLDAAALFAALVFALHPLRVESVSWIAERRETLCGAFWLGSALAYLRARAPDRAPCSLMPALALYVLACLAKGTALTLPAVLVLLDIGLLGRRLQMACAEKLPMFLAAGALGATTVSWLFGSHGLSSLSGYGLSARLAQTCYSLVFYVRKTAWPSGLLPFYEARLPPDILEPRFLACALLLACAGALAWAARKRRPALLLAAAVYAAVILPVSGALHGGNQLVADRYSYLATLPFALLAGAGLRRALRLPAARRAALAGSLSIVAALAAATAIQQSYWRDSQALWRRVLSLDPASQTAALNLGDALAEAGRVPEAAGFFARALAEDPECERSQGDPMKLEDKPVCRRALNDLGAARAQLGDLLEGRRLLRLAVSAEPGNPSSLRNLARVEAMLAGSGHFARLGGHGVEKEGRGREEGRRLAP